MLMSPELDAMRDQIRAIVLRDSEGFFDDPKENENLQITVRIACEFYLFLHQSDSTPELSDADYMAETIRSGLDWFFSLAHTGSVLAGLNLRQGFGQELPRNLSELRVSYDSTLRQLRECTRSAKAIGLLLSLVQMMLLFMTLYFPSFLSFSNESSTD
jgi:hypothetical protein